MEIKEACFSFSTNTTANEIGSSKAIIIKNPHYFPFDEALIQHIYFPLIPHFQNGHEHIRTLIMHSSII